MELAIRTTQATAHWDNDSGDVSFWLGASKFFFYFKEIYIDNILWWNRLAAQEEVLWR